MPPTFDAKWTDVGEDYSGMPALDQRGFPRVGAIDLGAVEYSPLVVNDLSDEPNTLHFDGLPPFIPSGPTPLGRLNLRQAIRSASAFDWFTVDLQAFVGGDYPLTNRMAPEGQPEVRFDPALFTTPRNITLTQPLAFTFTRSDFVEDDFDPGHVSVVGPGADLLTIVGDPRLQGNLVVLEETTLSGMTIVGSVSLSNYGGDLYNSPSSTLDHVVIRDSASAGLINPVGAAATLIDCTITRNLGGGILNLGQLTMIDCTISENTSGGDGGGLHMEVGAANANFTTLVRCTIRDNEAWGNGGGIFAYPERPEYLINFLPEQNRLTLIDSTIVDNVALGDGGGLRTVGGEMLVTGCTIVGNSAARGGGVFIDKAADVSIYNASTRLTLNQCTIAGNSAPIGAGFFVGPVQVSATMTGTIVSDAAGGGGADVVAPVPFSPLQTGSDLRVMSWGDGKEVPESGNNLVIVGSVAYNLKLMSWGDGSSVPASGQGLVIVGTDDDGLLHIRTFGPFDDPTDAYEARVGGSLYLFIVNAFGGVISVKPEGALSEAQSQAIAALKQQLPGFLAPHVLSQAEEMQILSEAKSIIDQPIVLHIRIFDAGGNRVLVSLARSGARNSGHPLCC